MSCHRNSYKTLDLRMNLYTWYPERQRISHSGHERGQIAFLVLYQFVFPYPICDPCTTLALPPSNSITQIRGHKAGPPAASPLRHMPKFCRENSSAFSSLIDSRRIVPTHAARRSQQFVDPIFAFLQIKYHSSGNRTQGPTLVVLGNHYQ